MIHYNDELLRLADELGQFEGGDAGGEGGSLTPSGNAVLLLDAIAAELGLLAPLAVSSGFCDAATLGTTDAFRFFVRQVRYFVCERCVRVWWADGVSVLRARFIACKVHFGLCVCVCVCV